MGNSKKLFVSVYDDKANQGLLLDMMHLSEGAWHKKWGTEIPHKSDYVISVHKLVPNDPTFEVLHLAVVIL